MAMVKPRPWLEARLERQRDALRTALQEARDMAFRATLSSNSRTYIVDMRRLLEYLDASLADTEHL